VDLPAFTLLGTYPGDTYGMEEYTSNVMLHVDTRFSYGVIRAGDKFADDGERSDPTAVLLAATPEDPETLGGAASPVAYVNEARPGADANVVAVNSWAYHLEGPPSKDDVGRLQVVEYYTCRDVKAGDELFVRIGHDSRTKAPAQCKSNKELYLGRTGRPECRVIQEATKEKPK